MLEHARAQIFIFEHARARSMLNFFILDATLAFCNDYVMHMTIRYGGNVHSRSEQHTNEIHKSERRDISLGQSIFSLALSRYDRSSSLVMVQFIEVPIDLLQCNIEHKM